MYDTDFTNKDDFIGRDSIQICKIAIQKDKDASQQIRINFDKGKHCKEDRTKVFFKLFAMTFSSNTIQQKTVFFIRDNESEWSSAQTGKAANDKFEARRNELLIHEVRSKNEKLHKILMMKRLLVLPNKLR